ncbi:MAG: glutamate racemase [Chloroflexi bacterium]|nr:MAG: glutamate racemase [Chloroflexota bacterium]
MSDSVGRDGRLQPDLPIGILDSGVGGLSVLRHIHQQLPHENLIYVADQAHVPYGHRPAAEVRAFTGEITRFLLTIGVKLVVVACNTASAAALTWLRETFPQVPFVGMEPAVKPAAHQTRSGKVGVLATAGTFVSQRYATLMERYARDVVLFENPCVGLVEQIEAGAIDTPETEALLRSFLMPMLTAGVDTIVLGCTHYPFALPVIERIVGTAVAIIDPAPAVARQTGRVLQQHQALTSRQEQGQIHLLTSGNEHKFHKLARQLLNIPIKTGTIHWKNGRLHPDQKTRLQYNLPRETT